VFTRGAVLWQLSQRAQQAGDEGAAALALARSTASQLEAARAVGDRLRGQLIAALTKRRRDATALRVLVQWRLAVTRRRARQLQQRCADTMRATYSYQSVQSCFDVRAVTRPHLV
jgi:hypothetical protein